MLYLCILDFNSFYLGINNKAYQVVMRKGFSVYYSRNKDMLWLGLIYVSQNAKTQIIEALFYIFQNSIHSFKYWYN